jgi:hypothetical protein
MKEAKAAQKEQWTLWGEMEKKSIDDMKANGVEITQLDNKAMADAVKKAVYEKHAKALIPVHRARPGREVTHCCRLPGRLSARAGPSARGVGNEGAVRPGDGPDPSLLHDHRRLLSGGDHADDSVGRVSRLTSSTALHRGTEPMAVLMMIWFSFLSACICYGKTCTSASPLSR